MPVELAFLARRLSLEEICEDVTLPPLEVGEGGEELVGGSRGED